MDRDVEKLSRPNRSPPDAGHAGCSPRDDPVTAVQSSSRVIADNRAPYETGTYKWFVAGALCLAHTISIADRFITILVTEPLRTTMGLTDTQLGLLQGTGFSLLYCGFAVPLGCVADATNRRRLIMIGLAFWSVATIAAAFSNSFGTLFLARVFVGMGEACLIPAAMSLLATYFAPSNLARGTAIFGLGANLGYGISLIGGGALLAVFTAAGGISIPVLGHFLPWQGVFLCAGLSSIPVLIILLFLREPPRTVDDESGSMNGKFAAMKRGMGYIWSNIGAYLPFLVVAAANSVTGYALTNWSTSLWVRVHGLTPAEAGKLVGIIAVLVGPLGTIAGGYALDRMRTAGVSAAPLLILAGGSSAVVAIAMGFVLTGSVSAATAFFAAFTFESFFMLPATYVGIQMLTPDRYRGVAASFNMMTYTLCGLGLGPTGVGLISDMLSGPSSLGTAVLIMEVAMAIVILPLALLSRGKFHARSLQINDERFSS